MAETGQPPASKMYSYSKPNDTNTGKKDGKVFSETRKIAARRRPFWYDCIVLASTE